MGISERIRHRLGLRSSNAAQPHRNRHRERHDGADWLAEWEEEIEVWDTQEFTSLGESSGTRFRSVCEQ